MTILQISVSAKVKGGPVSPEEWFRVLSRLFATLGVHFEGKYSEEFPDQHDFHFTFDSLIGLSTQEKKILFLEDKIDFEFKEVELLNKSQIAEFLMSELSKIFDKVELNGSEMIFTANHLRVKEVMIYLDLE